MRTGESADGYRGPGVQTGPMFEAAGWGAISSATLMVGAIIAYLLRPSPRLTAAVMAIGSGLLIGSVAYDLVADARHSLQLPWVAVSLMLGATVFVLGSRLIEKVGGRHRKSPAGKGDDNPLGIVLGSALDGIPESFVLGLSGGTLALGTLPPPPGRYCGVRLALAPADGDAMGLPDTSMEGLSIRLEGFFQMPGQEPTPLGVSTTMAASAPASLALTLGDDGQRSATLTVRLSGEHWLDGIDLATASADELSQAVVKAVAGSLTVDAS